MRAFHVFWMVILTMLLTACHDSSPFYGLHTDRALEETASMGESPDAYWWLNSGGYFFVSNRIGSTLHNDLGSGNRWFKLYAKNNPVDTDSGAHPQNIFRLVTKKKWTNSHELVYFKLNRYNASESPNRDGHNGVLLFCRYADGDNLYYAGVRVDGRAIVKKKYRAQYFTLAEHPLYPGTFHRHNNPNLIPTNVWIGLYASLTNRPDRSVHITLGVDNGNKSGGFKKIIEVDDSGQGQDAPIKGGYAGLRTDFMDVEFRSFMVSEDTNSPSGD